MECSRINLGGDRIRSRKIGTADERRLMYDQNLNRRIASGIEPHTNVQIRIIVIYHQNLFPFLQNLKLAISAP